MANLFIQNPVYITIEEVKSSTTKTALIAETDDNIKILITKAQQIIDNYIVSYGEKYDEDQNFIFPIKDTEDASFLPSDITLACFYCVEQVFVSWDLISWAVTSTSWWAVVSEKVWDRTVKYSSDSEGTTNNSTKFLWIPPEAQVILNKYRNLFIKNVI